MASAFWFAPVPREADSGAEASGVRPSGPDWSSDPLGRLSR